MTNFDMLFFALVATLVLIIIGEVVLLWSLTRLHDDQPLEPWIQVWPPDDEHRTHRP